MAWGSNPLQNVYLSDAKYEIPPGISNYGNSESGSFIISSGNSVNPSPFPHTLRSEPSGIRNPEFDCSLTCVSIQALQDLLGWKLASPYYIGLAKDRNLESGISSRWSNPKPKHVWGHSGIWNLEFHLV